MLCKILVTKNASHITEMLIKMVGRAGLEPASP